MSAARATGAKAIPTLTQPHSIPMERKPIPTPDPDDSPAADIATRRRPSAQTQLGRTVAVGAVTILVLALVLVSFLAGTVVMGAVIGQGVLVVQSGPKKVQHPAGGVISQLFVEDGEHVRAGQTLVVLDSTLSDARLKAAAAGLVQNQARLDRLIAERDGTALLEFPSVPPGAVLRHPDYEEYLDSERRQFALHGAERDGQRAQLGERIRQTEEELKGLDAQLSSVEDQIGFATANVEAARTLFKRKLITRDALTAKEKANSELSGSRATLKASIAANRGKIAESRLMILQIEQDFRARIGEQIAQTRQTLAELVEQRIIAGEAVRRNIIAAPQDGVVHELSVHTVGGVVQPAETLMLVVPDADMLEGEVRIRPSDIDQIYVGQTAEIHFSAFDRGTTPSLEGKVVSVSADLLKDDRSGVVYYLARLAVTREEIERLGGLKLVPGMPVEAFIRTDKRRILSYLTKPLADQMARAFR